MRQPSQKYSIKDDQKKRLNANHLAQQVLAPDQKLTINHNEQSQHQQPHAAHGLHQKSHDSQTQQIYDMMNLQNKQVAGAGNNISNSISSSVVQQRQLNLKMTLVQKQILNNNLSNNSKIMQMPSTTQQNVQLSILGSAPTQNNNMNNIQQQEDVLNIQQNNHYSQLSNINNSGNSVTTGSFFRQAALSQFQREQSNHSPEPQIQTQVSPFYQSGFDHSDRSTTANTGFPHFSTKTSTFHRKPTQNSNTLNTNTNQQINLNSSNNNFNSIIGNQHSTHLDTFQQQQQNLGNNSNALNMPQINSGNNIQLLQNNSQGQKCTASNGVRGLNQISRAYRQMHINSDQLQQQHQQQQNNENNSIPRNNFTMQSDILQVGGQSLNTKNNSNISSYLTIEKIKSLDKNPYQQNQAQQQSNIGGGVLLSGGHNSSLQNIGIGLMNLNSITNTSTNVNNNNNNNTIINTNTHVNQNNIDSINNELQTFHAQPSVIGSHKQSSSPLQKYIHSRQRNSEMHRNNQHSIHQQQQQNNNTANQNDSQDIQNINNAQTQQQQHYNKKDMKIRKGFQVQQKIQKPQNLRFQTAQFILDKQQQQNNNNNIASVKDKSILQPQLQQQQSQQQVFHSNNIINNNNNATINLQTINNTIHNTINNNQINNATNLSALQSNTQSKNDLKSKINNITLHHKVVSPLEINQSRQIRKLTDSISIQNNNNALKQHQQSSFISQNININNLQINNNQLHINNSPNRININDINNNNNNLLNVVVTRNHSKNNTLNPINSNNNDESDNERSLNRKLNNNSGGSRNGNGGGSGNNSKTRKISTGNDKEQIILKTLNLEERKRLIKQHQQSKQNLLRKDEDDENELQLIQQQHQQEEYIDKKQNLNKLDEPEINKRMDTADSVERGETNNSNVNLLELDIIEEEAMNDDIKSQYSKIKTIQNSKSRVISQSFTNLSSRIIDNTLQIPLIQSNHISNAKQQLRSPVMGQFKKAMFKSEAFKLIYKKIKEGLIKKNTNEYEKLIENLSKLSGMTHQDIELCVDISLQQQMGYAERFQNPYNKISSSSQETIEENIASVSLNHSFTYGNNIPIIARSGDAHSVQPSSGSSIWQQPLGFGNIINGVNQNKKDVVLGGSYKLPKNGEVIEEFKQAVQEYKSNGNGSTSDNKRSQYSKKSSSKKTGSESFTSGSRDLNNTRNRRRLGNMRSTGSQQSNDQLIYKININKSSESNSGNNHMLINEMTKEQTGSSPGMNNIVKTQASEEKDSSQKRMPLHQLQQQQKGMTLEQIKLRNQSLQPPKISEALNVQKAQLSEKQTSNIQGQLVRWKELKKIGQGTQGEVFIAQNIKNFNFFVVKKLSLFSVNSGIDKEALMKLKKEIEVYRKLDHQNIIKYIGSEIVNNQFCIYLEYMSSGSLQTIYQNYGNLQEQTLKTYTKQILNGLIYLHQNKVIHCDLKGANVLVDHNGIVKLSDFGCAKLFESSFSMSDFNGAIRGSLPWMAPEVVMNKGIRRKADIWSLGCMMIELAVGGNPWGNQLSSNNFQAIFKIADPNSKPTVPENLSPECQDFIKKCLIRDYEQRPSAKELQEHIWLKE